MLLAGAALASSLGDGAAARAVERSASRHYARPQIASITRRVLTGLTARSPVFLISRLM